MTSLITLVEMARKGHRRRPQSSLMSAIVQTAGECGVNLAKSFFMVRQQTARQDCQVFQAPRRNHDDHLIQANECLRKLAFRCLHTSWAWSAHADDELRPRGRSLKAETKTGSNANLSTVMSASGPYTASKPCGTLAMRLAPRCLGHRCRNASAMQVAKGRVSEQVLLLFSVAAASPAPA